MHIGTQTKTMTKVGVAVGVVLLATAFAAALVLMWKPYYQQVKSGNGKPLTGLSSPIHVPDKLKKKPSPVRLPTPKSVAPSTKTR